MTEKEKLIEKEFEGIDQALRRAAKAAKKLAEQTGTPYVVSLDTGRNKFEQNIITSKK
ncbi:hypothetical protein [Methylophilus methylotrophus]|uniref:hypothetical protein n=1 Tax=Methylophilus methylotrophus TaxID=17 RepID=UPI00037965EF|nr:hypothetical protein [Methylophilus methylotrophus]